jgi:hypothetical protein
VKPAEDEEESGEDFAGAGRHWPPFRQGALKVKRIKIVQIQLLSI